MDAASPAHTPMLSIDPAQCEQRQVYKLMTGIIVPRPIALVSTMDRAGVANLAPFSFFNGVGSVPPAVLFCPSVRAPNQSTGEIRKDTLRNVEETGEFVLSGLTPIASEAVRPPRVAESPAQMECKLLQVVYTGRKPASGVVVIGEVVRFHVRQDLFEDFRIDPAGLDAIGRMAGNTWVRTRERVEHVR